MASGNKIMVSTDPRGKRLEFIISGTPKPGTRVQIKAATEPVGGRHTVEVWNPSGGDGSWDGPVMILDIDELLGKTVDDAYVSGTRGFVWVPHPGDEINVRKADISGTGSATEDLDIGEKLMSVAGTGFVSPVTVGAASAATPLSYPFISLETLVDQAAEQLVHCLTTGS